MKQTQFASLRSLLFFVVVLLASSVDAADFERTRVEGDAIIVADASAARATLIPLGDAANSELVVGAFDWIQRYVSQETGQTLPVASKAASGVSFYFAFGADGAKTLATETGVKFDVDPGEQGFVVRRLDGEKGFVCWSPAELGLCYGVIEILRSLQSKDGKVGCPLVDVADAPKFPYRIYYVNFASHLQNAYNVNAVYDVDYYRWTLDDWKGLIDNISALRYNYFEFWLVPALMSPEALTGGKLQTQFAEIARQVIDYARSRGVEVHPIIAINTIGREWHYHCPNVPEEKAEILAIWEHWIKELPNLKSWGIFPGDPGGCTKNGCTKQTYVDLSLEIARLIKKLNPSAEVEVGTWGEPMAGWGVPLWTADEKIAREAMEYLVAKLPEFPEDTFASINIGFSPDCRPDQIGNWQSGNGDGRPFAKEAAKIRPVLTWDYSVTEGEGTVYPHCRARRQLTARRLETEAGCYQGGIAYTMAPKLQLLNQFTSAEIWWNPDQTPEELFDRFGAYAFGDANREIARLIEEFECIPDWGYEPAPFPYSPERLRDKMIALQKALNENELATGAKLPFAASAAEYKESLLFFARLFQGLAEASISLNELRGVLRDSGKFESLGDGATLAAMKAAVESSDDFEGKARATDLVAKLVAIDVAGLRAEYRKQVYGIYDIVGAHFDDRSNSGINALISRFGVGAAILE